MEDFLGDTWRRRAGAEKQSVGLEEIGEKARIYENLKSYIKNNLPAFLSEQDRKDVEENFKDLQESIKRYNETIYAFNLLSQKDEVSKDEMRRLDENRHFAHNALIDQISILARLMGNLGLDTSWRDMIGYSRIDVQVWAQEVDRHITGKISEGGE